MRPDPTPPPPAPPEPAPPAGAPEPPAAPETAAPGPADEAAALRAQVAALEDRLRRQQADFLNEVQRIRRQADERARYAAQPVVEDLLGVADALHSALAGLGGTEQERRVADGLRLVEKQFLDALALHGVARIEAAGQPFDPAQHQAVLEADSPGPARTVLQVIRPGFTLHGRVVRPAHVIVSRPASPHPENAPTPPAPADDGGKRSSEEG
jgi:molecular chaperone GrpE